MKRIIITLVLVVCAGRGLYPQSPEPADIQTESGESASAAERIAGHSDGEQPQEKNPVRARRLFTDIRAAWTLSGMFSLLVLIVPVLYAAVVSKKLKKFPGLSDK